MSDDVGREASSREQNLRFAFQLVFLVGLVGFSLAAVWLLVWSMYNEQFWVPIAIKNFPVLIGLPLAAVAALGIVLVLETTSGRIEFEMIGLKFKGASGPIVLWVLCFAAIAGAINLLWTA